MAVGNGSQLRAIARRAIALNPDVMVMCHML